MIKLLRSNLIRITKSKTFWICSAVYILYAIILLIFQPLSLSIGDDKKTFINLGYCGSPLTGFVILVYVSVIIGEEFRTNAIRNKISIGHSKSKIYLSNLLAFSICALAVNLIFSLIFWSVTTKGDLISLIDSAYDAKGIFWCLFLNALTIVFYVSIYNLIIMCTKNTVLSIICGVILTTCAYFISQLLIVEYQFESLIYLYPTGIDTMIANGIAIIHIYLFAKTSFMPIFIVLASPCMIALTNVIGVKIFKKSDIH